VGVIMDKKYILGIDEGTSWVKVLIVDRDTNKVGFDSVQISTVLPRDGYVEQDPMVIWNTTHDLIVKTLSKNGIEPKLIAAIGIANQRETTVFWNNKTGMPYGNAVVWLDRRASSLCNQVSKMMGPQVVERVGMYLIPNTAAMLIRWLLDNDASIREGVEKGEACFGTVNSWLLWKLTGGKIHCSDMANMSVTLLQDAKKLNYDDEVLEFLQIPREILPELRGTGEIFGRTSGNLFSGEKIPVAGMLGDQMAAALGQCCVEKGMVKNTFGTGSFSVINAGSQYFPPASGLSSPFLWGGRENPTYGLEGYSEICGAAVDWLRHNMRLIDNPSETEKIAKSVKSGEPLYFVPAFKGLGTPNLDTHARGAVFGITAETTSAHLVKAVLDGIVFQTTDMIKTMEKVTTQQISALRVGGGMAKNDYVCQFQADLLDRPVERPKITESTVLGAIFQAGLTVGFWSSLEEIAALWKLEKRFEPQCSEQERNLLYSGWLKAVERSKGWIENS
jgi:glycerol kinase